MKNYIVLLVLVLLFLVGCEKKAEIDHSDEVAILVENFHTATLDTFEFFFETSYGEDSIMITSLTPGQQSNVQYFEDVNYQYREAEDIFLIKKGRFVIETKSYFIANCFCEPDLKEGQFAEGKLTIRVEGIDALRGEVSYEIIKE